MQIWSLGKFKGSSQGTPCDVRQDRLQNMQGPAQTANVGPVPRLVRMLNQH